MTRLISFKKKINRGKMNIIRARILKKKKNQNVKTRTEKEKVERLRS
jgi:hypothetical protein